jgi:hypothetical protein
LRSEEVQKRSEKGEVRRGLKRERSEEILKRSEEKAG